MSEPTAAERDRETVCRLIVKHGAALVLTSDIEAICAALDAARAEGAASRDAAIARLTADLDRARAAVQCLADGEEIPPALVNPAWIGGKEKGE